MCVGDGNEYDGEWGRKRGKHGRGLDSDVLLALLTAAALVQAPQTGSPPVTRGVSLALARHRAATIADVRYDLQLDLTALDSATGRVRCVPVQGSTEDLVLDFRGRPSSAPSRTVRDRPIDGHRTAIPSSLPVCFDTVRTSSTSASSPTSRPSGASIIRSHDATDGSDYLYTLLVPADASQLFPCFDQPDLKARVRLSLTTPPRG